MISAFTSQASPSSSSLLASGVKPVAKAIHTPEQSLTARWVPINRSFITLTKIILRAARERLGLANLAITLSCVTQQGYRHLLLVQPGDDIQLAAAGRVEDIIISTDMPLSPECERLDVRNAITLPVDMNRQRLGYLVATLPDPGNTDAMSNGEQLPGQLAAINDEIIGVIKRYQTRYRAIYVYGDQCYWIGNSQALRELDQRISHIASSARPVLVVANKGSGKIIAARTLHCERHTGIVPFIESNCAEWQAGATTSILRSLYHYADGGTLFLRNIDRLPESEQALLQTFVNETINTALAHLRRPPVDLVMTLSQRQTPLSDSLAHWLRSNTNALQLPELTQRSADIRDLVRFFVQDHSRQQNIVLSEATWQQLESYPWSNNVHGLKQLIDEAIRRCKTMVIDDELILSCLA